MSILADLFVSASENATAFDTETWNPRDFAEHGGILSLHLELLWAILLGREWDVDLSDSFEALIDDPSGESWLVRLPDDLVERLALSSPNELDQARIEWAATEEVAADPADLLDLIQSLRRLSELARATGRGLYLKGSL